MDKNNFKQSYNISDATPQSPTLMVMYADGFAEAVEEFINEKFRGVARVRREHIGASCIFCSTEYTAFMLKTLLCEIYGRVFLNVTIKEVGDRLEILIEADDVLPLNDSQMRNIIRLSRNAGMSVSLEEKRIGLSLSFSEAAARRVYAISVIDTKNIMLGKLHEIILLPELHQAKNNS